jgi:alpha-1,2-mannosyltransferase
VAAARNRALVRSDWRTALILLAPVGLLLWPVRYDLELGQINLVLVLMIVADLTVGVSWRGRRLPRGLLVGVAAAIKLTPLIFIPFLLLTRQWRAARNATLAFLVATLGMVALAPGPSWNYFTKYAFELRRVGNTYDTTNQTLQSALDRAGLAPSHAVVDLLLLGVFAAGLALAALAYRRSSTLLGVLICGAVGLMVSPISWQHHYVWCVPLFAWLVAGVDRPKRGVLWAGLGVLVFMATPPIVSDGPNALTYMRENAYVIGITAFVVLTAAMLFARSRASAGSSEPRPGLVDLDLMVAARPDPAIQTR